MILKNSTWEDAKKAFLKTNLGIIPIGSIESQGPHNPLGMECFVVDELARSLDDCVDAIITPTIPVSYSRKWNEFPGTLWVKPATLKAYLEDICDCLIDRGVDNILFINGHGSNLPVIDILCQDLHSKNVRCAQIDVWKFIGNISSDLGESDSPMGHSGELETSVMLVLRNDLVHLDRIRYKTPKETLATTFPDVTQYYPASITIPLAFQGDPKKANQNKGEIILSRCIDRLEEFIKNWTKHSK